MKKLYVVANWKSNNTQKEAVTWLQAIERTHFELSVLNHKEIIVCPPYPLLPVLRETLANMQPNEKLILNLGSQNVSRFEQGSYTGEVPVKLLQELCTYGIIGHSERRNYFNETDEIIATKCDVALKHGITPILCVQGADTPVPANVTMVAFEPETAIGTGKPDTPDNAETVAKALKEKHPQITAVLYGGSVTPDIVSSYTSMEHIDGVLVGKASLDAEVFSRLITNA